MPHDTDAPLRPSFHAALTIRRDGDGAFALSGWSSGAAALFGMTREAALDLPLARLLDADDAVEARLRTCCEAGGSFDVSAAAWRSAAGDTFVADLHAESWPADRDGVLLLVRDPRAVDDLRTAVREECRTKMLAMTARLAHELRNPLGSVLLNLALLREVLPSSPAPDGIDTADVLASAESQIARIQLVVQHYVDAMRDASMPEDLFADLAEFTP